MRGKSSEDQLPWCHVYSGGKSKYLKSETHLRNAQVNKACPLVKDCENLSDCGHGKKNWSWIVVAGCGLQYVVRARFGLFWVVVNFSKSIRYKYLFFAAMKIHTMVCIVKKQNNFIFSSLII